ncbi:hypothetical protein E5D57_009331 [Metarhizium anisopliae]|nr:hypothetical protein E5D57_009331 [Metarhizium anisopliae]
MTSDDEGGNPAESSWQIGTCELVWVLLLRYIPPCKTTKAFGLPIGPIVKALIGLMEFLKHRRPEVIAAAHNVNPGRHDGRVAGRCQGSAGGSLAEISACTSVI